MPTLLTVVFLGALAYIASVGFASGGYGLVSGSEYLLLGILLGPNVLGVFDVTMRPAGNVALIFCVSWIGLLFGLRQRRAALVELGGKGALAVLIETALPIALLVAALPAITGLDRAACYAIAIVAAPSTKSTLSWARDKLGAHGRISSFLQSITYHDDIVPILALLALCAFIPAADTPATLSGRPGLFCAIATTCGVLLGTSFALIAGRRPARDAVWVILLGIILLAAGVSTRLGIPTLFVGALVGLVIAASTADVALLDEISAKTERPIVIVLLLLTGTRVHASMATVTIIGAAIVLRIVAKALTGIVIAPLGGKSLQSGFGLLGFGGVALAIAAQLDLLYPERFGPITLVVAAAAVVIGDFTAPLALRYVLSKNGELSAAAQESTP